MAPARIEIEGDCDRTDSGSDATDQSETDGSRLQGGSDRSGRSAECAGGQCVPENAGRASPQVNIDSADDRCPAHH